jgi:DNA-binding CsgD family transcriptional regulator
MFSEARWAKIARTLDLSKRELEMTLAIFNDDTEFAIASTLGLSRHTVHAHCRRLYQKLGVTNRVNLVLLVVENGHDVKSAQVALHRDSLGGVKHRNSSAGTGI